MTNFYNTMKKILLILLVGILGLAACDDKDEPYGEEFFQDLYECPTNGIYEGFVFRLSEEDNIGLWCEITKHPDDVSGDHESIAPQKGMWIYISGLVFKGRIIENKTTIRFRVLGVGNFPPKDFPYGYLLYMNRCYCTADIELVE